MATLIRNRLLNFCAALDDFTSQIAIVHCYFAFSNSSAPALMPRYLPVDVIARRIATPTTLASLSKFVIHIKYRFMLELLRHV